MIREPLIHSAAHLALLCKLYALMLPGLYGLEMSLPEAGIPDGEQEPGNPALKGFLQNLMLSVAL